MISRSEFCILRTIQTSVIIIDYAGFGFFGFIMLWQKYLQNLTIFLLTIIVILYIIQNVVHDKKPPFIKIHFSTIFSPYIYMNLFLVKVQQIQFSFWLTGFVVFVNCISFFLLSH